MSNQYSVKKAALINAMGKYSKVVIALIINAILARILSAEDYGIVAVITVFSTLFTTISDMGFGTAVIQNKDLDKDDIDNIFSFSVLIALVLMLIFVICSYPISLFYEDRIYISLGLMLSVSLFFNALNMVPNGILNREKRFISIAVRTVVVYLGSAIITIILAILGLRYYALAIQAILTSFFTYIWNAITTKPRFKLKFSMKSVKKVINYSGYQFAFNVVNYISRNLDNLLTGKFMGNAELGYYNKAYTLMLYPVNNLAGVVSPVLHPILSDYQKELDIIYKKYIKVVKLLAVIGVFVEGVCIVAAPELIRIMYGNYWKKSIACFQLLSFAIITQMINASTGAIFQAIGKTKLLFITSCANTSITVIAIIVGVFVGKNITFLSGCVAIAYLFHFITAFYIMMKYGFGYKFGKFIKEISINIIMLIVVVIAALIYPFTIPNTFVSLMIKGIYMSLIYCVCMYVTKEYKILKILLKR